MSMNYPSFFDDVEKITLIDPLSDFLGNFKEGVITFSYLDIVKCAGHSCPTVAGAYLMTLKGLKALYGDELPVRGNIHVAFGEPQTSGVTGVIGAVMSNITGATHDHGFKGLAGGHSRVGLMDFEEPVDANVIFTRVDSGARVSVTYNPYDIEGDPRMGELMSKKINGIASVEESQLFGELWQQRVSQILIDHFNDPECIQVNIIDG
jgi:hypothetical protein